MFNLVKPGVLINVEDTLQLLSKQTDLYAAKKIVEDMINQFKTNKKQRFLVDLSKKKKFKRCFVFCIQYESKC